MLEKKIDEVTVTQYLMPDARKKLCYTSVGEYHAKIAEDLEIELSAEMLTTGMISVYGRLPSMESEDALCYVSANGPKVQENLKKIIKRLEQGDYTTQEELDNEDR